MVQINLFLYVLFVGLIVKCNFKQIHRRNSAKKFENIRGYEYGTQKFYSNIVVHKQNSFKEKCDAKQFKDSFKNNLNNNRCQPRDAVVQLVSEHNYHMSPNMVVIKRCFESGCYGPNTCAPKTTREVQVAVRISFFDNVQCAWVNVTEHTSCKCGCMVTPEDCNLEQEYSHSECACHCKNLEEKNECLKKGFLWNHKTCNCECHTNWMECSTGFEWVPRVCKCMRIMLENQYERYTLLT